jgi:hypothetical protein
MAADCGLDFAQVCRCTLGWRVSSIRDGVDGHALKPLFCRPFEQSANVVYMAVYAAIGAETEQMQGATSAAETVGDGLKRCGAAKPAFAYGFSNTHQLLPDDPTGSNGEMPDF